MLSSPRITSTTLLAAVLLTGPAPAARPLAPPGVAGEHLPADLLRRLEADVRRLQSSNYVTPEQYEAVLAGLRESTTDRDQIAALQRMTQLMFDHDQGNRFLAELAYDLDRPELHSLGYDVVPAQLEVEQIVLRDGRTFLGTGGPLSRHFPHVPMENAHERRYLEPSLGLDGLGGFWMEGDNLKSVQRVSIPAPTAFLRALYATKVTTEGQWEADGLWFLARVGSRRKVLLFRPEYAGNVATLWVNDEHGVRCARPTVEQDPEPYRLTPAPLTPESGRFLQRIHEARDRHPSLDWPRPFVPDPERLAAAAQQDLWDPGDELASLLRVRFALTYGEELPGLARERPHLMREVERRTLAALQSGDIDSVLEVTHDIEAVAAAVRHAPRGELPPEPGPEGEHFVAFPRDYTPWRRWPLLVALHGQYCQPQYDFNAWQAHAEAAGMVLLCPRYGSTRGTPRDQATDQGILDLIRHYTLRYAIDPDRIYLTGLSMGGATTWHLAQSYPSRWAAFAPEIHGPRVINQSALRLANVRALPCYLLDGEFDGFNTVFNRLAVKQLERWDAPLIYFEAELFGHQRLAFQYPDVLRYFSQQTRRAHPTTTEILAFHAHEAQNAWLALRDIERPAAWTRTDGALALGDLTGIKAVYSKGVIQLTRTEGEPMAVEIYHDARFMAPELRIRYRGKTHQWTPRPSIRTLLQRARFFGEKEQLYGDSVRIEF